MSLLSWLRGDDLRPTARDEAPPNRRMAVPMLPSYQVGRPSWPDATIPVMTRDVYRKCITAFSCLNLIADATAEATLRVYDADREEVPDHPVRALMQRPNPTKSEYEYLAQVVRMAGLTGICVSQKVRSSTGRLVELWPFNSAYLRPVKYDFRLPDWDYHVSGREPARVTGEDAFVFTYLDSTDPTDPMGDTPMRAILREAGIANDLTDFIKLTLERGGAPMFVIVAELPDGAEPLEDAEVGAMRERFAQKYGGVSNWTGPAYVEGATIERLGFDLNEMAFKDLRNQVDAAVCSAFRIPAQMVQTVLGAQFSTYANYRDALRFIQMYVCGPLRARLDGAITRSILPELESDLSRSVEFDTSRVEALQESEDDKHKRAVEALRVGGITLDAFAKETGRPEIGGELGKSLLLPFSVVPTPITGGGDDARRAFVPVDGDGGRRDLGAGLRDRRLPAALNGHAPKALPAGTTMIRLPLERRASLAATGKATIARLGEKGAPALRRFWKAQGERVVAAATRSEVDWRNTGPRPDTFLPLNRDIAQVDWDEEERLLRETVRPLHALAGETAFGIAGETLGIEIDFDLSNPNVRRVLDRLAKRIGGISETTRDDVRRVVGEALDEGVSLEELSKRLKGLFEETYKSRAMVLARTESQMAYNLSSALSYAESGVVSHAELSDNPEHTDDYGASDGETCATRHGMIVTLDMVERHASAEHPNGSLCILPVLSTPLGEE